MEMMKNTAFMELNESEMNEINGGDVWGAACAAIAGFCAVAAGAWNAGRRFVKDIRKKWF